jgi:hypothetical protein
MKLRVALATAALGAVTLVGLAACGQGTDTASLSPEATALSAIGFAPADLTAATTSDPAADPTPSASASTGDGGTGKHPRLRALAIRHALGKNVEHGEIVVNTKNGDKTVDVERGTVTAISSTSITVKATDGFSETWTIGSSTRVIKDRATSTPSTITNGATVGIAGTKSGSTVTATLIVIPQSK